MIDILLILIFPFFPLWAAGEVSNNYVQKQHLVIEEKTEVCSTEKASCNANLADGEKNDQKLSEEKQYEGQNLFQLKAFLLQG